MTEVVLVGCTKTKREHPAEARDLYDESPLFRKRRRVARIRGDWWNILSAEHGLVRPENWLEPYDTYIGNVDSESWAENVLSVLLDDLDRHDEPTVTILAGKKYVDPLVPELESEGYEVLDPLRGLMPGQRMSKLDDMAEETEQRQLVTDGGQPEADTERERVRGTAGEHTHGIEWSEDSLIILKCLECKRPTLFRLQICHEADDHDYRAKSCCRDCISDHPLYEIRFRKLDSELVNKQSVDFGCHVPDWAVRTGIDGGQADE